MFIKFVSQTNWALCGLRFVSQFLNVCWRYVFSRLYSFLHFRTETFIRLLFNLRFDNVLGPRRQRFFLEPFSSAQDVSLLVLFLLEEVSSVTVGLLFIAFQLTFFGLPIPQSFSNQLLIRTTVAVSFDWLYFLPHTSSRPSPADLFCFAPRFHLSSDWLLFGPRTSSRPSPADLFCFAPECPLHSDWRLFVPRTSSRASPTDLLFLRRGFFCLPIDVFCFPH